MAAIGAPLVSARAAIVARSIDAGLVDFELELPCEGTGVSPELREFIVTWIDNGDLREIWHLEGRGVVETIRYGLVPEGFRAWSTAQPLGPRGIHTTRADYNCDTEDLLVDGGLFFLHKDGRTSECADWKACVVLEKAETDH